MPPVDASLLDARMENRDLPRSPMHWWGWYAVVVIVCATLLPQITSWGMSLDGITYAAIGRNLSIGLGTWHTPHYTETLYPNFHEHPPLGFILQSAFFFLAGDHYLVEKVYSFVTMLATLLVLWRTWNRLAIVAAEPALKAFAWLPALMWITTPRWNWTYKSNMLENTMGFFCLLAFYLVLRAMTARRNGATVLFSALSAVSLACGCLTKGPVGLFPLVAPLAMVFALRREDCPRRIARGTAVTAILGVSFLVVLALVLLYEPLRSSLAQYFRQQVLASLSGARTTQGARTTVLLSIAGNLAPMAAALLACIVLARHRRRSLDGMQRTLPVGLGCIAIGLAGSLPLLVSPKAMSFYLVPSLPFFALGFATLLAGLVAGASRPREEVRPSAAASARWKWIAPVLPILLVAWSLSLVGKPRKDREIFQQLQSLRNAIPPRTIIGGAPSLGTNWSFHAFLNRHLTASLDTGQASATRDFFLVPPGQPPPDNFRDTGLKFGNCSLLKRLPPEQPRAPKQSSGKLPVPRGHASSPVDLEPFDSLGARQHRGET